MVKVVKKAIKKSTIVESGTAAKTQVAASDLPRKTIQECLAVARPIHETYAAKSVSWDEIAAGMNRGALTPVMKYLIWGTQAYGLIIKDGDNYKLTETAKKIFTPESEVEKRENLIKAITIPTILSRFYTDYNGKFLPEGEFFDNILFIQCLYCPEICPTSL